MKKIKVGGFVHVSHKMHKKLSHVLIFFLIRNLFFWNFECWYEPFNHLFLLRYIFYLLKVIFVIVFAIKYVFVHFFLRRLRWGIVITLMLGVCKLFTWSSPTLFFQVKMGMFIGRFSTQFMILFHIKEEAFR